MNELFVKGRYNFKLLRTVNLINNKYLTLSALSVIKFYSMSVVKLVR